MPTNRDNRFRIRVLISEGGFAREKEINGRDGWALFQLIQAGETGCTSVENPGPRWSAYIYNLRHKFGIEVETTREAHEGQFAGSHARYILRSSVMIIEVNQTEDNGDVRRQLRACHGRHCTA